MAGDIDGAEAGFRIRAQTDAAEGAQQQAAVEPMTDAAVDDTGTGDSYERAHVEREARIAELEAQVADSAKSAEAVEGLRAEIAEVQSQVEANRVEYELRLAGALNVKATAFLDDHGGDVAALREAEPGSSRAMAPPIRPGRRSFPTRTRRPTRARR